MDDSSQIQLRKLWKTQLICERMISWLQARTRVLIGKQLGFSDYELTTVKKRTKRERFLAEMEPVVSWSALIDLIEPHYPKATKRGGQPPYPLALFLVGDRYSPQDEDGDGVSEHLNSAQIPPR
jgi:hypothetical protein